MRASLRRRVNDDERAQGPDAAVEWLQAHGVEVLRIGRRAFSVEAEPGAFALVLDTAIDPEKPVVLEIDREASPLGTWFDLLEVTPRPEYFRATR